MNNKTNEQSEQFFNVRDTQGISHFYQPITSLLFLYSVEKTIQVVRILLGPEYNNSILKTAIKRNSYLTMPCCKISTKTKLWEQFKNCSFVSIDNFEHALVPSKLNSIAPLIYQYIKKGLGLQKQLKEFCI